MIMYASCTDVGGRLYNEDCVAYKQLGDDCLCVVLADGLGGHGGGEIASRLRWIRFSPVGIGLPRRLLSVT